MATASDMKQQAIAALAGQLSDLDARLAVLERRLNSEADGDRQSRIGEQLAEAAQDRKDLADSLAELKAQAAGIEPLGDEDRGALAAAIRELSAPVAEDEAFHARLDAAGSVLGLLREKG